ncbi:MAG TPA: HAD-IA family hydrolase [Candidatus Limnocylindria bacterium]
MPRYEAVGFDLLTALLDTRTLWTAVAGDGDLGLRWHAASQRLLRGQRYWPFEDLVREAAESTGIAPERAEELLARWGESQPWPDTVVTLEQLGPRTRFVVTNCSIVLGALAAANAGTFDLVMTAEEAGAYKPDPQPYVAALERLGLDPARVLFVAGSAHDVGGAGRAGMDVYWANRGGVPAPEDGTPIATATDLSGLLPLLAQ